MTRITQEFDSLIAYQMISEAYLWKMTMDTLQAVLQKCGAWQPGDRTDLPGLLNAAARWLEDSKEDKDEHR